MGRLCITWVLCITCFQSFMDSKQTNKNEKEIISRILCLEMKLMRSDKEEQKSWFMFRDNGYWKAFGLFTKQTRNYRNETGNNVSSCWRQKLQRIEFSADLAITYTHSFVRTIRAIEFSITAPFCCYAIFLGALELFDWITFWRGTFSLIWSIATVIISITDPTTLDTSTVVTGELIWPTRVI